MTLVQPFSLPGVGKVLQRRKLTKLIWHVTNRCNFACTYCYVVVNRFTADLPTESMLAIAEKINASGVRALNITGGEAFARDDLIAILERITPKIRIGIATNGSKISPEVARFLADRDIFVSITIDSLDGETNRHTRVGSDTPRLLENVKLLIDSGVRTGLSTVATRTNVREVDRMAEYFQRIGGFSYLVGSLRETGEALESRSFDSLALDYGEEEGLLTRLYALRQKYRPEGFEVRASLASHAAYFETFSSEEGGLNPCLCGYARAVLKHDGGLVPCDAIKYPEDYRSAGLEVPNVLKGEALDDLFLSSRLFQLWTLATSAVVPVGCSNCNYFEACRGWCRGMSLVRARAASGLFGRSTNCARNDKLRASRVRPLRVLDSAPASS